MIGCPRFLFLTASYEDRKLGSCECGEKNIKSLDRRMLFNYIKEGGNTMGSINITVPGDINLEYRIENNEVVVQVKRKKQENPGMMMTSWESGKIAFLEICLQR
jgi:hypothetical protein